MLILNRSGPEMGTLNRRSFLRGTAAAGAAAGPFGAVIANGARAQAVQGGAQVEPIASPYGTPVPTRDLSTGLFLLNVPPGFSYSSFGWAGDAMTNGARTPAAHDGMGMTRVAADGTITLVRNHEVAGGNNNAYAAPFVFDRNAGGGTTNVQFARGRWIDATPSSSGTFRNCAGGDTTWGTWLTCEETFSAAGDRVSTNPASPDFNVLYEKNHGYVFEIPAVGVPSGRPIVAMGRFPHEAVSLDPPTGIVYETEDNSSARASGYYRFKPTDRNGRLGSLELGGTLEMLRVTDVANADLRTPLKGDSYAVSWVLITEPDAAGAAITVPGGTAPVGVPGCFAQGYAGGGAIFRRLEGAVYYNGRHYFADTAGGAASTGTIWEYTPDPANREGDGTLTCIFVSGNRLVSTNVDNIVISPRGGLMICEDGSPVEGRNTRLQGLTGDGLAYDFIESILQLSAADIQAAGKQVAPDDYGDDEFAGAVFDPTGRFLFFNAYSPGITFAVSGPWARGNL